MEMAKDSFVFYREWMPLIKTLPDASRLKFYDMLCVYGGGEFPATGDPHLDGVVQFVFTKVSENNAKYTKKCEKAAESAKIRWDANACERIEPHTNAMPKNANVKNAMLNDNDNDNDLIITPTPSSPDGKEASESKKPRAGKKSKVQTTLEQAIDFYKTQSAGAVLLAPAAAESYKQLAYEICGKKTLDCPEGMVKTIMRLPEQLHFDQYQNLCKIMGGHDVLRSILLEMHNNYEQYLTKRHSINLVAQDWYKNRQKKQVNSPRPVTGSTISAPKEVIQ